MPATLLRPSCGLEAHVRRAHLNGVPAGLARALRGTPERTGGATMGRRATGRFGPGPVTGPAKTGATRSKGGACTMSRLSLFNSPLLLGFDHIEEMLDRLSKAPGDSYP